MLGLARLLGDVGAQLDYWAAKLFQADMGRPPTDADDLFQFIRNYLIAQRGLTGAEFGEMPGVEIVCLLREEAVSLESRSRATPCIESLGDRKYGVNGHAVQVTDNEDTVLTTFLGCGGGDGCCKVLGHRELVELSGLEGAHKVLKRLEKKYGGLFADAVKCPGAGRKGGYRVYIRDGRPSVQ